MVLGDKPANVASEKWTVVDYQKKANKVQLNAVQKGGNAQISTFQAIKKKKFLHVWSLHLDTTEEAITEHITTTCGSTDVKVEKIIPKTKRDYSSFMVGVPESDFGKINNVECWPLNANFNEWFDKVIVLGDFNMPSASVEIQSYMEYVNAFCGFRQVNNVHNINNRTLDLVLSALPAGDLEVYLSDEPLVPIDVQHPPLVACMTSAGTPRADHRSLLNPPANELLDHYRSKSDYAIFSKYRSMVKEKLTATFDAYQERLQSNFMNDPKSFWSFIRRKQSKRDKTRVTKDGVELKDEECAECFASYFHSVYSPSRPRLNPREAERAASRGADSARVHVAQLTPSDLRVALRTLKPKHSVGPDGIPPYIIKDCRVVLEKPLLHVFNRCLKECHYPDRWKTTRVIPVPKGGGGADVSGYRPIAVLSAFAKCENGNDFSR
ncbi:putative RNA-directed DNA polymerase from transposon BS [Operophtera brumata]|uniref:Putative RNA-directed DNA polymerase from transposon BS n=1 Tax=Operophtera brumata TaxID=104452 RepID=A0A0L7L5F1_OPEBR|nr:putative RNA-directed DNA polymerase from transposon BS [Operophtera brumata]